MTLKPDSGYHIPVMRGATKSKKKEKCDESADYRDEMP